MLPNGGSVSASARRNKKDQDDGDDLEAIGAEADDRELEMIRNVCETEIVNGENLLASFVPLVVHVLNNPNR